MFSLPPVFLLPLLFKKERENFLFKLHRPKSTATEFGSRVEKRKFLVNL